MCPEELKSKWQLKSNKWPILGLLTVALIAILLFSCAHMTMEKKLLKAVDADDLKTVQRLLKKHPLLANTVVHQKAGDVPILCHAILRGHTEIAKLLLSAGADPNVSSYIGWGPLHMAASRGQADIITPLIQNGAGVNGDNSKFSHCPLAFAWTSEVARILIENGADVNFRNLEDATPLHKIARLGNVGIAEVLIAHGAEVNARDRRGFTPLHRATQNCHTEFITLLIDNGANINAQTKEGHTPLEYGILWRTNSRAFPARPRFYEMIKLLISKGSHYTIGHAVRAPDLQRAADLLDSNPELTNTKDHWGDPLLFCAIREGHPQAVDLLIQRGAKIDATGKFGDPPLHAAAYAGNPDTVGVLLQAGANVNKKGAHGELALHWVSRRRRTPTQNQDDFDVQIAKMLIDGGSELDVAAENPRPDMWCGIAGPVDQIAHQLRWLEIENKPTQKAVPPWLAFNVGDTPLHSAARWGRVDLVGLLIKASAKINPKNEYGQTPLHYAIAFKHLEVVEHLLDTGADPKAKMKDGTTAMQLASKVNDDRITKPLKTRQRAN